MEAGSLVFLNQFDEHATRMISDVYRRYYLLIPPTQMRAFHNDARLLSVFRFHGEPFPYVLSVGADKPRFDTYFSLLRDAAERGGAYMDERIEALMTLVLADALALRPDMFPLCLLYTSFRTRPSAAPSSTTWSRPTGGSTCW